MALNLKRNLKTYYSIKEVSEMFDLSLRGYYVAHVSTQGWGEYREIWFKIRKSGTHQTNITKDTISAFLKVLEPTLKGGF